MKTNTQPSYSCEPRVTPETGEPEPFWFSVFEHRDGRKTFLFKIDVRAEPRGERRQNLLKRGIPFEAIPDVFYAMDANKSRKK